MQPLYESNLTSLPLISKGKVRDIYDIDAQHLLIVTTDRVSAFDVILPTPIPGKGRILTDMAQFWMKKTQHIVPNQLVTAHALNAGQVFESLSLRHSAHQQRTQGNQKRLKRHDEPPQNGHNGLIKKRLIQPGWAASANAPVPE